MLLIQILISDISGQTLDDGKAMCHASAKKTSRNAQDNQAQSNQMSPRTIRLSNKGHAEQRHHRRRKNSAHNSVQPERQIVVSDKWAHSRQHSNWAKGGAPRRARLAGSDLLDINFSNSISIKLDICVSLPDRLPDKC